MIALVDALAELAADLWVDGKLEGFPDEESNGRKDE